MKWPAILRLSQSDTTQAAGQPKSTAQGVFVEQLVDSAIVAGIAGISVLAISPDQTLPIKAALISFTLTFLLKLKEYRHL